MPKASIKRLIECKKKDLINLVLDIEKYPEFIPFCHSAKIHEKEEAEISIKIIYPIMLWHQEIGKTLQIMKSQ